MSQATYVTDKQLAQRFSVGRATIWRWLKERAFPAPIRLSPNCTRWKISDIEAWELKQGGSGA